MQSPPLSYYKKKLPKPTKNYRQYQKSALSVTGSDHINSVAQSVYHIKE